jgi:RNA polymerase sigma-70 factor (ECF subfamily)
VIRPADPAALPPGRLAEIRGAGAVVKEAVVFGRGAAVAELALIDGIIGIAVARGRLVVALTLTFGEDRISRYSVIANPARLVRLSISLLDYPFVG